VAGAAAIPVTAGIGIPVYSHSIDATHSILITAQQAGSRTVCTLTVLPATHVPLAMSSAGLAAAGMSSHQCTGPGAKSPGEPAPVASVSGSGASGPRTATLMPNPAASSALTVTGKVADYLGAGLAGTTIAVLNHVSQQQVASTTADAAGLYSVPLAAAGTYDLVATPPSASGYHAVTDADQPISAATTVDFSFVPAGTFTLRRLS